MKNIEIYFDDLSKEKQEECLKAYGITNPSEANWDIFPLTVLTVED